MRKKSRGRLSHRERIQQVNQGLRSWGVAFGKPEIAEKLCSKVPEVRTRKASTPSGRPLERDVLKAIVRVLQHDPRVVRVERNQSGVFQDGERYIRVGVKGKLDLTVYLKSGRYAEIEVKRDGKTKPEPHQQARIDEIRRQGGIAGWAWSAESAIALLP